METNIRKIEPKDYEQAARIKAMSFAPDDFEAGRAEATETFEATERMHGTDTYVCEARGQVAGVITIHQTQMNFHGKMISAWALGGVAVGMQHRMQGVANSMIRFFLQQAVRSGAAMGMLYPFDAAFYAKYGFGWGAEKYEYVIETKRLPYGMQEDMTIEMTNSYEEIGAIHRQYAENTHGMCLMHAYEEYCLRRDTGEENVVLIREADGTAAGYAVVEYEKDAGYNPYDQTVIVQRMAMLTREARACFLSYLHSLKSQFATTKINTYDPYFYYNLSNIGDIYHSGLSGGYHFNCRHGLGIMYKAIQPQKLLDSLGAEAFEGAVGFVLSDPMSAQSIYAAAGKGVTKENTLQTDIAAFGSWIMGCVPLSALHEQNRVQGNKQLIERIDKETILKKPINTIVF